MPSCGELECANLSAGFFSWSLHGTETQVNTDEKEEQRMDDGDVDASGGWKNQIVCSNGEESLARRKRTVPRAWRARRRLAGCRCQWGGPAELHSATQWAPSLRLRQREKRGKKPKTKFANPLNYPPLICSIVVKTKKAIFLTPACFAWILSNMFLVMLQ